MKAEDDIIRIKSRLAAAITKKRQDDGLSQEVFARSISITQSMLSQIENGHLERFSIELLIRSNCAARTGYKLFDALK